MASQGGRPGGEGVQVPGRGGAGGVGGGGGGGGTHVLDDGDGSNGGGGDHGGGTPPFLGELKSLSLREAGGGGPP